MGIAGKALVLIGALVAIVLSGAARADEYEDITRPVLQAFVDCVVAQEPAMAKSDRAAPAAADAAIAECKDKLDAFKAVLVSDKIGSTPAEADETAGVAVDAIRPKVIKRIGELRGAL